MKQTDCFGMAKFGVSAPRAQIPGYRVVGEMTPGVSDEGAQKESQINCCQAGSEAGSQGIRDPGPGHANSCLVLLIWSHTHGAAPCPRPGGTRPWHRWLPRCNGPAVSTLAREVKNPTLKSLVFCSCLQEVLHFRSPWD